MSSKILLVSNYLPDAQESMQRFTSALEQGLSSRNYEIRVIRPQVKLGEWKHFGASGLKWLGYLDKFLFFPQSLGFKAAIQWADLVHVIDHSNAVYYPSISSKPNLITCHDFIAIESSFGRYPQNQLSYTGKIYQKWILSSLDQFSSFSCVSHHTKERLTEILDIVGKRATVIHNGLNYPYSVLVDKSRIPEHMFQIKPFILHVGGNQWYKNRLGVLRIFNQLLKLAPKHKLVMVGKPFTKEMNQYVIANSLSDAVISRISISNRELEEYYNYADALLFPSLIEGFGWPIIEAQACDCPVVCSSCPPLPEVAGSGALIAAPSDEEMLASHLWTIIHNQDVRSQIIEKGKQNITRFTPDVMIASFDQMYQDILFGK